MGFDLEPSINHLHVGAVPFPFRKRHVDDLPFLD